MTGDPLRLAFLGCGGFAQRYHVPALRDAGDARVVLIVDPQPTPALRETARTFGADLRAEIAPLLAAGSCDAAIVSTPHMLHYAHVDALLDAGLHVLVDKPFVMRVGEAKALTVKAATRARIGAVAFNRRFDRGCVLARALLASGAIGEVRYVEATQLGYEQAGWFLDPALGGGGPYTGRASHLMDLIPWLTGAAPQRLRSRLREGPPGRSDRGGFIDIEFDRFACRMTCIEEGWRTWDELRIFGDDGLIELRRPLALPIGWRLRLLAGDGAEREDVAEDATPGGATRDFVDAVRRGRPPACDFAEATLSVLLMEAAFASARSGERWIDLDDFQTTDAS
jgi:predicted dehydrogenase